MVSYQGLYNLAFKGEQAFTDWLYGPYDRTKYSQFAALYAVPGIHQYMDYLLDQRRTSEYMNRHQLSYSDIHDPRKLYSTQSIGSMVNFVSSNVKRLYK